MVLYVSLSLLVQGCCHHDLPRASVMDGMVLVFGQMLPLGVQFLVLRLVCPFPGRHGELSSHKVDAVVIEQELLELLLCLRESPTSLPAMSSRRVPLHGGLIDRFSPGQYLRRRRVSGPRASRGKQCGGHLLSLERKGLCSSKFWRFPSIITKPHSFGPALPP